jgi:hypothetical protein
VPLTTHLHLTPRLKKEESYFLLPFSTFLAWSRLIFILPLSLLLSSHVMAAKFMRETRRIKTTTLIVKNNDSCNGRRKTDELG